MVIEAAETAPAQSQPAAEAWLDPVGPVASLSLLLSIFVPESLFASVRPFPSPKSAF